MRNRSIPSVFRTGGRLFRWNRRYSAQQGKPVGPLVSLESCQEAVRHVRAGCAKGGIAARYLCVRNYALRDAAESKG
jgi:hypothetical protein